METVGNNIYSLTTKNKIDKIFKEIVKFYPEKKIFYFDILCPAQKKSLISIAEEMGIAYEQILLDYGYEIITEEDAKTLRTAVIYLPGNEPNHLDSLLSNIMKTLNKYYPQKIINNPIEQKHKRLFLAVHAFSLYLGYRTVFDFFTAYGYSYCVQEKNNMNKDTSITTVNNQPKDKKTVPKRSTNKKMFLKPSKTVVESLKGFYEACSYLKNYKNCKWKKDKAPKCFCYYYKFTSNLIMRIYYVCSMTNYGTTPVAKLEEITVAFRDGVTEYALIKEKLNELKIERAQVKKSKKLDEQIEWLEYLNRNIKNILPKFSKPFEFNTGEQLCSESITIDKTKISSSSIASQYVVLDLETNGLRTAKDDLLSISLYDPSTGKFYNRLLPLELQPTVLTTYINGIDDTDVASAVPLSQKEFDDLIEEFDLTNKTILFYSGGKFDFDFLDKYCRRHKIFGMDSLKFENIKNRIASSSYTAGNLTKDNLCNALGIEGVSEVHSGVNDCYLEWQLFEQFVCDKLLIKNNYIYKFSDDYIIPASYLTSFPKLAEFANIEMPKLHYQNSLVYEYYLPSKLTKKIRKFPTNINGISIENIINSMVGAKECDNSEFLNLNNRKLKIVGKLTSDFEEIPVIKREDGTLKSLDPQYEEYIRAVNETSNVIRSGISEVIDFIREKIFANKEIRTQEISFAENNKVFALCDLSSDGVVLEIKTFNIFSLHKSEDAIRQMYYQKGDKALYAMSVVFDFSYTQKMERRLENLIFRIDKVEIEKD